MHIAIAGNIGSGKTTLAGLLAKHFKWEAHYEDPMTNPYINDFYDDMQRWSFNMQIFYLNSRFNQILEIRKDDKNVIQDRTIYEDAHIFAPNLHSMRLLTGRDYKNYKALFNLVDQFVSPPDLIIYLKGSVPTLVKHIQSRGRAYEESIRLDYLKKLNERYDEWVASYDRGKLLVVDVDQNNFHNNPEDLGEIVNQINAEINGLF